MPFWRLLPFAKFTTLTKQPETATNGEKPGLVVRAEDSRPRGRVFESRRILDGCKRFASYYIKEKLKNKGSQMGHTKKIFKKKETATNWLHPETPQMSRLM